MHTVPHCNEYISVWTKIYLHRSGPSPDICQQTSVGVGYTHAQQEIIHPVSDQLIKPEKILYVAN